ncbi:organic cation transporter protein-like [Dermacentor variabilis]|uniref:organic cation transporter protein-like n=1 Tax=Dermacentor variabilis TaxID=34621 RepID=UPI003F5C5E01
MLSRSPAPSRCLVMDFDKVLDHIGEYGRFQLYVQILACLPPILSGAHQLAHVFLAATPEHRCFIDGCDVNGTTFHEPWATYAIPDHSMDEVQCYRYDRNSSAPEGCTPEDFLNTSQRCDRWIYSNVEFDSTIVTEFNLVCKDAWLVSTSQSLFMVGVMVASVLFGHLSDRYGRRICFLFIPPVFMFASWATVFTSNYVQFTVTRIITAMGATALYQTSFVLAVELVGPSRRLISVLLFQLAFPLGEILLAAAAYMLPDWRRLSMALAAPTILLLPYYWLLPESLAWCMHNKKEAEAIGIINRAARWNRRSPVASLGCGHACNESCTDPCSHSTAQTKDSSSSSLVDLFRTARLCCRTLNVSLNWLVNAMVYYGLSLSADTLGGTTFHSFGLLALIEIPGVLLAIVALQWCGRRIVLSTFLLLAGLFCVIVPFIPEDVPWLSTTLVTVGKCCITASFAVIYLYSAEVFPTSHRNTAIGIGSMSARFGTVASPFIASDLGKLHPMMPMIVLGALSLVAGIFTLALPETSGMRLPETIQEAENLGTPYYFSTEEERTSLIDHSSYD